MAIIDDFFGNSSQQQGRQDDFGNSLDFDGNDELRLDDGFDGGGGGGGSLPRPIDIKPIPIDIDIPDIIIPDIIIPPINVPFQLHFKSDPSNKKGYQFT